MSCRGQFHWGPNASDVERFLQQCKTLTLEQMRMIGREPVVTRQDDAFDRVLKAAKDINLWRARRLLYAEIGEAIKKALEPHASPTLRVPLTKMEFSNLHDNLFNAGCAILMRGLIASHDYETLIASVQVMNTPNST